MSMKVYSFDVLSTGSVVVPGLGGVGFTFPEIPGVNFTLAFGIDKNDDKPSLKITDSDNDPNHKVIWAMNYLNETGTGAVYFPLGVYSGRKLCLHLAAYSIGKGEIIVAHYTFVWGD